MSFIKKTKCWPKQNTHKMWTSKKAFIIKKCFLPQINTASVPGISELLKKIEGCFRILILVMIYAKWKLIQRVCVFTHYWSLNNHSNLNCIITRWIYARVQFSCFGKFLIDFFSWRYQKISNYVLFVFKFLGIKSNHFYFELNLLLKRVIYEKYIYHLPVHGIDDSFMAVMDFFF